MVVYEFFFQNLQSELSVQSTNKKNYKEETMLILQNVS